MERKTFISVILPLKLEWEPCYRADEGVGVGERVKIRFAGKEYVGVVSGVGVRPDVAPEKVKDILDIEIDMGMVLESEIELWRRVADYYMCSVGEVYKAAYPYGKINLEQARAETKKKVCERREKTLNAIISKLEKLEARLEKKTLQARKSKDGTKTKAACLMDIEKINKEILAGHEAKDAAERNLKAAQEGLTLKTSDPLRDSITLSEAQTEAYNKILEGFDAGKPVLLHGVTGSGKTEIYLKLAHRAITAGKNVLYLVPEIALSRQLEDRLHEHFSDRLIVFHSGESTASRRNAAEVIRNSGTDGYILLCTRSGLFLPHNNLGLIIVDEEHDTSYKQDSPAPRYNGRDTALILNQIHTESNIILGSATPSFEEIYNTDAGRHLKVDLRVRYHGCDEGEIEIIDTKAERRKNGMRGNFSFRLIRGIAAALNAGEQVLILRSRRAWSSALQCSVCGEIVKCPHCNVSMSYHKSGSMMVCHYCGHKETYHDNCNKCRGPLSYLGAGTQRIEEEIGALFPDARIARLDGDTAQNKSYETKTIRQFAAGEIDILVGTQMITKGFDFEKLSLVAIIAADTLLGMQDFRADEKALQLMEQFRGRSGRRGKKGRFIIQTSQPDHPIYRQLRDSDRTRPSTLMLERMDFGFPPFSRIIEITIKDTYRDRVERMSVMLAERLNRIFTKTGQAGTMPVTQSYSPVVDRIADHHIRKIRICFKKDKQLHLNKQMLRETVISFEKANKYEGHIIIDVDPS